MKAPEHLELGAQTYRERNEAYGDSYHKFGEVMAALFPSGLTLWGTKSGQHVSRNAINEWNRLGALAQIVNKLCRYSNDFLNPQDDSIHDLMVYAAMLEELDGEDHVEK